MNKLVDYLEENFSVEKYFNSVLGLVFLCISLMFILTGIDGFLEKGVSLFRYRCLVYTALEMILVGIWIYFRNYMPKNKENIGLVIGFQTENKKQKTRMRNDFVKELETLLEKNNINFINTIVLTNHQSICLDNVLSSYRKKKRELKEERKLYLLKKTREYKRWKKIRRRIKGHFYLWGNIKERLDEENKYFITINGLVVHRQVRNEKIRVMMNDLIKFFPNKIYFSEKFELRGFHLTADLMCFFARYVIGCAAFLSGDYYTTYKLFNGLTEHNLCSGISIEKKINLLLSDCLALMANSEYIEGKKELSLKYSKESLFYNPLNTIALDFLSVFSFNEGRKCDLALSFAKKSGESLRKQPGCWKYNEAFLYMYTGKFYRAVEKYKTITKENFYNEENVVEQCISFNELLYLKEPQKKQCQFIIALLYYLKRSNLPMALEKFESFIEETNGQDGYDYLRKYAYNYILEIIKQMGISEEVDLEVALSSEK